MVRFLNLLFLFCRYRCFFLLGILPYKIFLPFKACYGVHNEHQAKRLRLFLQNAGPAFIKLGQLLSTRVDFLSDVYIKELSLLQDKVKYESKKTWILLQKDLGTLVLDFKSIDKIPINSASVASVYKGVLQSGESVAIKVIKPNVQQLFSKDLKLLYFLFASVQKYHKMGQIIKPVKIIQHLEEITNFELDLRYEAASCETMADNFAQYPDLVIPKIYWRYVTKDVLVQSWIDGTSIANIVELKQNQVNLEKLCISFVEVFFTSALVHGFFHGDLHPGNILITKDKKIALIDFGIMGKLDQFLRLALHDLFVAFLSKDYTKAAKIHFDLGWVSNSSYKVEDFALACRAIIEKNINLEQDDVQIGQLLQQLFKIATTFNMEVQEQVLLLQKNLIYLEGIGRSLVPQKNVWIMSKGILEKQGYNYNIHHKVKNELAYKLVSFNKFVKYSEKIVENYLINSTKSSSISKILWLIFFSLLILNLLVWYK